MSGEGKGEMPDRRKLRKALPAVASAALSLETVLSLPVVPPDSLGPLHNLSNRLCLQLWFQLRLGDSGLTRLAFSDLAFQTLLTNIPLFSPSVVLDIWQGLWDLTCPESIALVGA